MGIWYIKSGVYLVCLKNTPLILYLKGLWSVLVGVFIWEIIRKTWGYILMQAKNSGLMKVDWQI